MYIETWHKTICDFCNRTNWVKDDTQIEIIKCYQCGEIYGIFEDNATLSTDESIKGKEFPE
jgi:hypothetical protein